MPNTIYALRREKLRRLMHQHNIEALLVSLDANRYYLSGFELHDPQVNESAGMLLITSSGNDWLCTDARYHDAAKRLWDEKHIFIYKRSAQDINTLLKSTTQGSIGFEAAILPVRFFQAVSDGLDMIPADGLIERLRVIKDTEEITQLEASVAVNHAMMDWLPSILQPGHNEAQIAWSIEQFFRNKGAQELAFSSIVAINENAALPHAIPSDKCIEDNCEVLVDAGCRVADYCSDQTRTFWVGDTINSTFATHLAIVQEVQQQTIAALRPGLSCAKVYHMAKNMLDAKGVGHLFTHGLGHGIGLQTHEAPSLNATNDTILQAGMVITIEPGVYVAGRGGIRWEHMVLITEDSYRVL